jgi:hypothetical protein
MSIIIYKEKKLLKKQIHKPHIIEFKNPLQEKIDCYESKFEILNKKIEELQNINNNNKHYKNIVKYITTICPIKTSKIHIIECTTIYNKNRYNELCKSCNKRKDILRKLSAKSI